MFNFSQGNSFEEILTRCLARVSDTIDKRQGSIIYDAIAPACAELAQCYISLDVYANQTYLATCTGKNLDNLVANYGIERTEATYAKRNAEIRDINDNFMTIATGTRFSVPNEYGGYNFTVIEEISTGNYILECETVGIVGNQYSGTLLPLESINNLGSATLTDVYIAGEDKESDEDLRQRAIEKITETPFRR